MSTGRINLRQAGDSYEFPVTRGQNRVLLDFKADDDAGGMSDAVVTAEWSSHMTSADVDPFPETWHGFSTPVLFTSSDAAKLAVDGATKVRLRVSTAASGADPSARVYFKSFQESV